MNDIELAWAAGFFDGEGSVGLYASGRGIRNYLPTKYPKVSIANTNRYVLDRFQNAVGIGKVYGPKRQKNPKWRDRYDYRLDGINAVMALYGLIGPYLSEEKQEQFSVTFENYRAQYSNR